MKKLITILLLLSTISCTKAEPIIQQAPNSNRFELVQLGAFRRDQYLLDKETGQLWTISCMANSSKSGADCDYTAFLKVDVEGLNGVTRQGISEISNLLKESAKGGK